MTRISQNQIIGPVYQGIINNRQRVAKYSEEITTGLKVVDPSDSNQSGTISQFKQSLERINGYKNRVGTVKSFLTFQESTLGEAENLLIRAKEIAQQAANDTQSDETRRHMAQEVYQIRDHLVSLANSTYAGKYAFGGTRDDDPPFDMNTNATTGYVNPATGQAHDRWQNDALGGRTETRTVNITESLTIEVNHNGDEIFSNGINALERLARALDGYATNPATGAPNGTGNAYVFPTDYDQQVLDIRSAMDMLDDSREQDILQERIGIGGKLRRLETADSLLDLSKVNLEGLIDKLQNADTVESASNLAQAQTALEASFTVTSQVLNLSILDYI